MFRQLFYEEIGMLEVCVLFAPTSCTAQVDDGDDVWFLEGKKDKVAQDSAPQMRNLRFDRFAIDEVMEDFYPFTLVMAKLKMLYSRCKALTMLMESFADDLTMSTRKDCTERCVELCKDKDILQFIHEILLECPLPEELDISDEVLEALGTDLALIMKEAVAKWRPNS